MEPSPRKPEETYLGLSFVFVFPQTLQVYFTFPIMLNYLFRFKDIFLEVTRATFVNNPVASWFLFLVDCKHVVFAMWTNFTFCHNKIVILYFQNISYYFLQKYHFFMKTPNDSSTFSPFLLKFKNNLYFHIKINSQHPLFYFRQ